MDIFSFINHEMLETDILEISYSGFKFLEGTVFYRRVWMFTSLANLNFQPTASKAKKIPRRIEQKLEEF
jgi:hypothetical protein